MNASIDVAYGYAARVVAMVDGNLLDLDMEPERGTTLRMHCRLDGVVAPALYDPDPEERKVAEHARDFVEVLLLGQEVVVRLLVDRPDGRGRWRAVVYWRTRRKNG